MPPCSWPMRGSKSTSQISPAVGLRVVLNLGLPFREAHHVTGKIVALAESQGVDLKKLPLSEFKTVEKRIDEGVYAALDVAGSVKSRTSYGGAAPANVKREARRWIKRLEKQGQTR